MHLDICFVKRKTAYGMRISGWSSDVCSSDLLVVSAEVTPLIRLTDTSAWLTGAALGVSTWMLNVLATPTWTGPVETGPAVAAVAASISSAISAATSGSSAERLVGAVMVSTSKPRWSPYH